MPQRLTAEDLESGRARVIRRAETGDAPGRQEPAAPARADLRKTLASIASGIAEVAEGQEALAKALKGLSAPRAPDMSGLAEALSRLGEIQEAAQRSLEALRVEVERAASREVVVKIDSPPGPQGATGVERATASMEAAVKALARAQAEGLAAMREAAERLSALSEREVVVQVQPPAAPQREPGAAVELSVTERDAYGRIRKIQARRIDS